MGTIFFYFLKWVIPTSEPPSSTLPTKAKAGPTPKKLTTKILQKWQKTVDYSIRHVHRPTATSRSRNIVATEKKHINFDTFCKLTDELAAKHYKGDPNASQKFRDLIVSKGSPENHGTKVASGNNVAKMTDTSQYTGAHKERFDESGHGKGKEGRENVTANDGYVTGYKGKDTYDNQQYNKKDK